MARGNNNINISNSQSYVQKPYAKDRYTIMWEKVILNVCVRERERDAYLYGLYKQGCSISILVRCRMPSAALMVFGRWKIPWRICQWSPCKFSFKAFLLNFETNALRHRNGLTLMKRIMLLIGFGEQKAYKGKPMVLWDSYIS